MPLQLPRPLLAVAGEQQHHRRPRGRWLFRRCSQPKRRGQFTGVSRDEGPAAGVIVAPFVEHRRDLRERMAGPVGEVGQRAQVFLQRRRGFRGNGDQSRRLVVDDVRSYRRLFHHYVHVRPGEPEGAEPGPPRSFPAGRFGVHHDRRGERRVGPLEVRGRVPRSGAQRADHLEQPGDPGGVVEMAEVPFDRTDRGRTGGERFRQTGDLDHVPERGARTVRLDVTDVLGADARFAVRRPDHLRLRGRTGRAHAHRAGTVVVHRDAGEHREHGVLRGECRRKPFQYNESAALAPDRAVRGRVERAAHPGTGNDPGNGS